ncbi:hypothetical protein D3C84_242590 [compost metagenome]
MEPAVSVPMATLTIARWTAMADPEEEPPGTRGAPSGRSAVGVPKCGFRPRPEKANSARLVLPRGIIPSSVSRAITGASSKAAGDSARMIEPAVVRLPATSIRSFTA